MRQASANPCSNENKKAGARLAHQTELNHAKLERKSPSRRTGDRSSENIVIVRGALEINVGLMPAGVSHRSRCRILTRALIGPSEVEFERAPLGPLLTLDAVFSIQCLVFFRHLPDHRKQPCVPAARSELYGLADEELEIHLLSFLIGEHL
jgi:hypothetical protein